MPERIEPMKATLAKLPADDDGWGYEIKWDGVRAIAYCQPGHLRLESRNLREITRAVPGDRGDRARARRPAAVLDGELVAFDERGPAELPAPAAADARRLGGRGPPADAATSRSPT